jgi:hypothetical protein
LQLTSASTVDAHNDIITGDDSAKDGVLGWGGAVEEVQEAVVDGVDEELRSTRIRLASVSLNDTVIGY